MVAHTNNTGRMTGCLAPGAAIWLSPADNPQRKLKWTLELVETVADPASGIPAGVLVGVNTAGANRLAAEALAAGISPSWRDTAKSARKFPTEAAGPGSISC